MVATTLLPEESTASGCGVGGPAQAAGSVVWGVMALLGLLIPAAFLRRPR